jgi:hypothetical protein
LEGGVVGEGGEERVGICVSGGGIRSAAFSLGALQALQEGRGLLKGPDRAAYLAAVSGGSYVAAAFAQVSLGPSSGPTWRTLPPSSLLDDPTDRRMIELGLQGQAPPQVLHPPLKVSKVDRKAARQQVASYRKARKDCDAAGWRTTAPEAPLMPGTPENDYVRRHAQYLGSLGGTFGLVAGFLTRAILNLLYTCGAAAVFGFAIGLVSHVDHWHIDEETLELRGNSGLSPWTSTSATLAAGLLVFVYALAIMWITAQGRRSNRTALQFAGREEILLRELVRFTLLCAVAVLLVPRAAAWMYDSRSPESNDGGSLVRSIGLLLTSLASVVTVVAALGRSLGVNLNRAGGASSKLATRAAEAAKVLAVRLLLAAAWLSYPVLLLAVTSAAWLLTVASLGGPAGDYLALVIVIALVVLSFLAYAVPQYWSLHRPYMFRLASCFSLVRQERMQGHEGRAVGRGVYGSSKLSTLRDVSDIPELLICAAVNVSDRGTSAAGTHVRPLVFSPWKVVLDAGEPFTFDTRELERALDSECRLRWSRAGAGTLADIFGFHVRLVECVALTGAAVSPAMGKMTKGAFRSILSVMNLRLGQWIPNPASEAMQAKVREHAATADEPDTKPLRIRPRLHSYVREAAGIHPLGAPYIYASDGGHYENLGLVELLRRRCTEIWCIDASGDRPGSSMTLSESLLIAQGELGVRVDLDVTTFEIDDEAPGGRVPLVRRVHQTGTVTYSDGSSCELHVVKLALDRMVSPQIVQMRARYRRFPYDSTLNQLYNAERFDAYRELGRHSTRRAIEHRIAPAHRPTKG